MPQFKNGDIVQLKSGGPIMTIKNFGKYDYEEGYLCVWYENKQYNEKIFTEEILVSADDDLPPVM